MNRLKAFCTIFCASIAIEAHPQNIVTNGSFEDGWNNGPVGWGWTTNIALGEGFSGAADGTCEVDLYGTLFQTLHTTIGQKYEVRYAVSGNSGFPGVSVIGLTWGGHFIGNTTWTSPNTTGNGLNWDWVYGDFTVVADSASTVISFQGYGTSWKPSMDAVSVVAIPEPGVVGLAVFGLIGCWCRHRRAKL